MRNIVGFSLHRSLLCLVLALWGCGPGSGSGESESSDQSSSEPLTVCAQNVVHGIGVSEFQGNINWSQVKAAGKQFSFMRATEGTYLVDADFNNNWTKTKAAGVIRGAYHFLVPGNPSGQAAYYLSHVKFEAGDLPPMLDLEASGVTTGDAAQWVSIVEKQVGRKVIVYTSPGYFSQFSNTGQFADEYLFVADWGVQCPNVPSPWKKWTFWQLGSGSVSGIPSSAMINDFDGTLSDLKVFADGNATPPPSDGGTDGGNISVPEAGSDTAIDGGVGSVMTDGGVGPAGTAPASGCSSTGSAASSSTRSVGSTWFGLALAMLLGLSRRAALRPQRKDPWYFT